MPHTRRILHVDDDPAITRLVAKGLGDHGYTVTSLNDPTLVIEKVMADNHRVVILDLEMPSLDGSELLRQIKGHDPHIEVIMLTGTVSLSNVLQARHDGALAFIAKPVHDFAILLNAVRRAFAAVEQDNLGLSDCAERGRLSPGQKSK
ncbi:MAG TPA: response regulator [Thermoguttaceae bacterium]|nr:response regulator [Thermoguttaceae bacterium]